MNRIKLFSLIGLIVLCCLSVLAACNTIKLHEPVELKIDHESSSIIWTADPSSDSFQLDINGKKYTAKTAKYSYADLEPGEYSIKVRAISKSRYYSNSAWSEPIEFEVDADYRYVYSLINSKTAYEIESAKYSTGEVIVPDTFRGLPVTNIAKDAFKSTKVTDVTIGSNVRSIGAYAFANSLLKNISIPENVTIIGANIFQDCRYLTGVTLPQNMTSIPNYMFADCRSLSGITLPDGVTQIGLNAFANCAELKSVTIPDTVTEIGVSAFQNCNKLETVVLGIGVKKISTAAFYGCVSLVSITVPKSVTSIAPSAFQLCSSLNNIIFEEGNEYPLTVGDHAFSGATQLKSINLPARTVGVSGVAFNETGIWQDAPEGVVYAGKWAIGYKNVNLLAREDILELSIKDGTVGLADYSLQNFSKMTELRLPSSLKYTGMLMLAHCESLTTLVLPEGLISIADYSFSRTGLTTVNIPDSVQKIGMYAFNATPIWREATNLIYVDKWVVGFAQSNMISASIDAGIVGISDYAFYNHESLEIVNIPDSVKIIGNSAFYKCSNLMNVTIPDGVEKIGDYTFEGCEKLSMVKLGTGIKSIGNGAFKGCYDLSSINLPDELTQIGAKAFYECASLVNVSIPDGVDEIADYTFFRNINLKKVVMPSGVKNIGDYAFYRCDLLEDINIGTEITSIGSYAFYLCSNLTDVALPGKLEVLGGYAFYGCQKLTEVSIPDGVKKIGAYAFYKCYGITGLEIGAGVEIIGAYAFYEVANISTLILPKSVKEIGAYAFFKSEGLTSVVFTSEIKTIDNHAFYGCNSASFYTEHTGNPINWSLRWNSSNRPLIYGAELSADKTYVVSLAANRANIQNSITENGIAAPMQKGYKFEGWSLNAGSTTAEYSMQDLPSLSNATRLYAIWTKI